MPERYSRPTRLLAGLAGVFVVQSLLRACALLAEHFWTIDIGGRAVRMGPSSSQINTALGIAGSALGIGILALLLARSLRRKSQLIRDEAAQRLANDARRLWDTVAGGESIGEFVLYLRPFALEPHLHEIANLLAPRTYFLHPRVSFDYALLEQLGAMEIPLLCIGEHGAVGAGRVAASDSEWRQRFRELAGLAKTIVVVPGRQPGIRSEIHWLREVGLMGKAVFFKPLGYPKDEWLAVRRLYEEEDDIELPGYSRRQLSFHLDSTGRCHHVLIWRKAIGSRAVMKGGAQLGALLTQRPVDGDRRMHPSSTARSSASR